MPSTTYKDAGVDIDEGNRLVELVRPLAESTRRPEVVSGIGDFAGLFALDLKRYREPLLVASTDGVGTKLRLAFEAGAHRAVGEDLVAMVVNDIVTLGAEPLFFLDYFATGKLVAEQAALVVEGIGKACREAGCALLGGETAEMPSFYPGGEYELAGFGVGVVERQSVVDGSRVREGDVIIGLHSSGLHANGFSLARRILFQDMGLKLDARVEGLTRTLGEELLQPTRIYVRPVLELLRRYQLGAIAHITGGGLVENLPRVLPRGLAARIDRSSWEVPPIFRIIAAGGGVSDAEMLRTFNLGIGLAIIVPEVSTESVMETLRGLGYAASGIGEVFRGEGDRIAFT